MHNSLIQIISRYPVAGKSKTRLIPAIGAENAANLQKEMTEFILNEAFYTYEKVQVHFNGGTKEDMQNWLFDALRKKNARKNIKNFNELDLFQEENIKSEINYEDRIEFIEQAEGDLGIKLQAALVKGYISLCNNSRKSRKKIIIIGADCPSIRKELLDEALLKLDEKSCVIGPSVDGGYYLIGFALEKDEIGLLEDAHIDENYLDKLFKENKTFAEILDVFNGITWGSEKVFAESIAKIEKNKISYQVLQKLSDVDYQEDIPRLISIIIPTLNEEENMKKLLYTLPSSFNVEIIVVDGNSNDNTRAIARHFADKVIVSEKGRSLQMRKGFEEAKGDFLFFMHADSLLPASFDSAIRKTMEDESISLGYFDFAVYEEVKCRSKSDNLPRSYKSENKSLFDLKVTCLVKGTNLRTKYMKRPYGDQGLFVRRKDFEKWQLPPHPIMEDVFLVKKALEYGRIASTNLEIATSLRRWEKHGFFKVFWINQSVVFATYLGMDLEMIKQCYWQGKNPLWYYVKSFFKK